MFLVINVLRSKRRKFLYVWYFARGASEIYILWKQNIFSTLS